MGTEASLDVKLSAAGALVRQRCAEPPVVGVVLGSGLGSFADSLADAVGIPYLDIPHMPRTTVVASPSEMSFFTSARTWNLPRVNRVAP